MEIKGIITDAVTNQGLPYASIYIKGSTQSTISNNQGAFQIFLNNYHATDTLVISYLGYESYQVTLNKTMPQVLRVKLRKQPQMLSVISIHAQTALELLKEAIRKIPDNYPTRSYLAQAFYRDFNKEDSSLQSFSEALILMKKSIKMHESVTDSVELLKGKTIKLVPCFPRNYIHELSEVYDVVMSNQYFLNPRQLKHYDFWQENDIIYDGRIVIVISFDQKSDEKRALYTGKIYLDSQSLAFIRIEFALSVKGRKYWDYPFWLKALSKTIVSEKIQPMGQHVVINYLELKGKWYLNYIQYDYQYMLYFYNNKSPCFYQTWAEMTVTDIDTNLTTHIIDKTHLVRKYKPVVIDSSKYKDRFWKNNSVIQTEKRFSHLLPDSLKEK